MKAGPGRPPFPSSTYRVQLNPGFTLRDAVRCVPYLRELGVGHLYVSPLFQAREGSLHGYDVTDFSRVNPELGGEAALRRLARALKRRGMGLLLDIVPNHMCISGGANPWWHGVLEHGPASAYASFFDIDWAPGRVLLPVLGESPASLVRRGEIAPSFEEGAFWARCGPLRFPLEPRSWSLILARAKEGEELSPGSWRELERVLALLDGLPPFSDVRRGKERSRKAEDAKRRLGALASRRPDVRRAIAQALGGGWDEAGAARLLDAQPYRLAHWREALGRLNYRCFFDVSDLAALRVERPEVFEAVHSLVLRLVARGWVQGLRVDHVDGLADPERYLRRLRRACPKAGPGAPYILVEKILAADERLPARWPVQGTTGYEFLNLLNGLFVAPGGGEALRSLYARFIGRRRPFPEVARAGKAQVLRSNLAADVRRIARLLRAIATSGRGAAREASGRDWEEALRDLVSAFSVYRTYLAPGRAAPEDVLRLKQALRLAARTSPPGRKALLRWIGRRLGRAPREGDSREWEFVTRLQQLTGPAMAKGFEDTALYRYFPLASLNEVGGEPDGCGVSPARFHAENLHRLKRGPGTLLATSTHDTKRSEDVRARLNVLSEVPVEWARAILRWRRLNRRWKGRAGGRAAPGPNEEYLLYQTLAGAWPPGARGSAPTAGFVRRIQAYMHKAAREAKERTRWLAPDADYEEALRRFVASVLDPRKSGVFLADLRDFVRRIERPGLFNSVSQVLLKAAAPGVPDIFQGCETVNLSLVDPDNRRPVDFTALGRTLASLRARDGVELLALARRLARSPEDGRLKLFVLSRALDLRRKRAALFREGDYLLLRARGGRKDHLVAFARRRGGEEAIAAAGRFFSALGAASRPPLGEDAWGDTELILPSRLAGRRYRDVLTGRAHAPRRAGGSLRAGDVFAALPVALLVRVR